MSRRDPTVRVSGESVERASQPPNKRLQRARRHRGGFFCMKLRGGRSAPKFAAETLHR
jgi:hypothetical protein